MVGAQPTASAPAPPASAGGGGRPVSPLLAMWAVPRPPAGCSNPLDGGAATGAGLAFASVDLELVLHAATTPVRSPVGAESGSLAGDSGLKSGPDAAMKRFDLRLVERSRLLERVDPRPPERLVCIDVPDARQRPLVQERRLHRSPATGERFRQSLRGEAAGERFSADALTQIGLELVWLDQEPRPESADVPVHD